MRLYTCNTIYEANPPIDINPLVLEANKNVPILILCNTYEEIKRILSFTAQSRFVSCDILCYTWDESVLMGLARSVENSLQLCSEEVDNWEVILVVNPSKGQYQDLQMQLMAAATNR